MELQNRAQSKAFTADAKILERRGTVGTFVLQPSVNEKSFGSTRVATTNAYRHDELAIRPGAISSVQNNNAKLAARINASTPHDVRQTDDADRQVAGRIFADERTFRDQGKSQKSLDRQNPPLTIEQVRELLNKNK